VNLIARKPKNLSMREAAAIPLSAITAWEGLGDRARAGADQTVLIHAGAGGVGYIAVQIALARGAKVFATVSPEKTALVASLGATSINYKTTSVDEYVSICAGDLGFDVVYDTVGGKTLDASFSAVKRYTGHVLSSLGWGSYSLAPLSFRGATYSGVFTLLPLLTGQQRAHHGKILRAVAALAENGQLRPLLHAKTFLPEQLAEAYRVVEAGSLGKVVVSTEESASLDSAIANQTYSTK
jgi:NADPH:quinone reductase-like Zn-dependent oxidoreductase